MSCSLDCSCFDTCQAAGRTLLEMIGCCDRTQPITAESLQRDWTILVTTCAISCALVLIAAFAQIGLIPVGDTITSIINFTGIAGILITAFATYKNWKMAQEQLPQNAEIFQKVSEKLSKLKD
jgi:predicted transporter